MTASQFIFGVVIILDFLTLVAWRDKVSTLKRFVKYNYDLLGNSMISHSHYFLKG